MPKRPKQHQLEDESRAKYELAIPREWVFRNKDKDYGIDGEVEIFSSNETPTGLVYLVQLKATGSKHDRTIKNLSLKLETLAYYRQLPLPVMIVRYSAVHDEFFVKWSHEIDPFNAKNGAKTIQVKFTDSDKWDSSKSPREVQRYLNRTRTVTNGGLRLPISCHIKVKSDSVGGKKAGQLLIELRQELRRYSHLVSVERTQREAYAEIIVTDQTLYVGIEKIKNVVFHRVATIPAKVLAYELARDSLLGIAGASAQLGYNDLSTAIVLSEEVCEKCITKSDLVHSLVPSLLFSVDFERSLQFISLAAEYEDSNIIESVAQMVIMHSPVVGDKKREAAYEKFLQQFVERNRTYSDEHYGHALYNVGNFYKNAGQDRKAAKSYLAARHYQPTYYEQGYYFAELAGILFELRKYTLSALLYQKAIKLDDNMQWVPLCADALMMSGKYKKSHTNFRRYLTEVKEPSSEWILKHFILGCLLRSHKVESQVRDYKAARSLAHLTDCKDQEEVGKRLSSAFEFDLINPLAWYNYGQEMVKEENYREAAFGFIICALMNRNDPIAWANALSCCMHNTVPIEITISVVRTAYRFSGEGFIDIMYEQCERSDRDIAPLTQLIESVLEYSPIKKPDPEMRMMNASGKFKNVIGANLKEFFEDSEK